jgi:uncharacterized membrane protein
MKAAAASAAAGRHAGLDTLRGIAIAAMVAYHFGFDLQYFKLIDANPYESPWWIAARTCILSSFLFLSGFSFVLAQDRQRAPGAFWRRWLQLAGCALLVSAGSYAMFPRSFIYFGVLHAIAVMWLLSLLYRPAGISGISSVILALLAPYFIQHPVFDSRWLNWTGLVTHKPVTEDYVPLLPWIGMFWLGMLAYRAAALRGHILSFASFAPLAKAGQWPLTIYMLHQPLLIGALMLATGRS